MKNKLIFLATVLTFCLMGFLSCDKSGLHEQETATAETAQAAGPVDVGVIETRVPECEDCFPHADCCCGIELKSVDVGFSAIIRLCGTLDGTGMCHYDPPGSSCPDTWGGLHNPTLSLMSDPKILFCMENDSVLCVQNGEDFDIELFLTCEEGEVDPDSKIFTLTEFETKCFLIDDCLLVECM